MDIGEYAEMIAGTKLPEWQKKYLGTLYELSRDNKIYICMGPRGRVYTYLEPKTVKELVQHGATINSAQ